MTLYEYAARERAGRPVRGQVAAASSEEVLSLLQPLGEVVVGFQVVIVDDDELERMGEALDAGLAKCPLVVFVRLDQRAACIIEQVLGPLR